MKAFASILLLLSFCTASANADPLMDCSYKMRDAGTADAAGDWPNAEILGAEAIKLCRNSGLPPSAKAYSFDGYALALLEQNKLSKALQAADTCLKSFYLTPGCHFTRWKALVALGRKTDAAKAKSVAESVSKTVLGLPLPASGDDFERIGLTRNQQSARFVLEMLSETAP